MTDQIRETADEQTDGVNPPDPDIQALISEWVVPRLIEDFLEQDESKENAQGTFFRTETDS